MSYDSWETGRREMYVQPFPGTTARIRVSANGGGGSSWRSDGREVYYASNEFSAVVVAVTPNGHSVTFGQPRILFRNFAAASPDGKRFLSALPVVPPSPITVLLNWKEFAH